MCVCMYAWYANGLLPADAQCTVVGDGNHHTLNALGVGCCFWCTIDRSLDDVELVKQAAFRRWFAIIDLEDVRWRALGVIKCGDHLGLPQRALQFA